MSILRDRAALPLISRFRPKPATPSPSIRGPSIYSAIHDVWQAAAAHNAGAAATDRWR
ncbi:hypothetical protein [Phenylobacterium sp. RIFCSPHIGHO2_01_FULL_69_31]|uniref:hypothetical protein n=1 Tax=Phenylobacterium sp. RIFCSPHIGHO2_01_FULL_69_31 TaxID=1801944 RepID=UPI0025DFF33D|nr:hypothetical protein [Phenylobacterium sp. RIFCSPHIGHO2_01_FULL_69_31]